MTITVQSTYLTDYVPGLPGMLADGTTQNRVTGIVADSAGIAFGKAAFQSGSTDGKAITATPSTKFKGITIENQGIVAPVGGTVDTYPQYGSASLLDLGDIWIQANSTTTPGAAVYVDSSGNFTATSTSNTAIPASFVDAVTTSGPCRIRVVQQ